MNQYSYFTEIEQRFQQRRGSILMLSTLDWALIETWHEAGVPLAAVLQGIDDAFDRYEQRAARAGAAKARLRRVNGLAWAAQAVMVAAQAATEASKGLSSKEPDRTASGLEPARIAAWLRRNARQIERAGGDQAIARRLTELAGQLEGGTGLALEELDRTLTVLEEKQYASMLATASEAELVELRSEASQALAPYRRRMQVAQIRQVEQQFLHKRLLELRALPRLGLFYIDLSAQGAGE